MKSYMDIARVMVRVPVNLENFGENLKIKENMFIQREKMKWFNDGDVNSKYFHAVMKKSLRHNFISSISTSGGLHSSVEEVK